MKIYTYSEDDREFMVIDGRNIDPTRYRKKQVIKALCSFYGIGGLILLSKSASADFKMESFDRSGLPWNEGQRCAVSFADLLGIKGFYAESYEFETTEGISKAVINSRNGEEKTITLADGTVGTALCEGECCGD